MSTRAVYTFKDSDNTFHIYKHSDGYPEGAATFIKKSVALAWPLPRFEASEFSAAFVAANKERGGDIYLTGGYDDHGDLDYRYEITFKENHIYVKAFNHYGEGFDEKSYTEIFNGTLENFEKNCKFIE